jgi:tetratricopeptide (TPR) repeat protein
MQLDRFYDLLFGAGMLGIQYELDGNYTAQEAFDKRLGNCLSVAFLATALLRDSGTRTYFQEVDVAPSWGQLHDDNSVVVTRHINVVTRGFGGAEMTIEFDRVATGRGDYLDRRRITDRQAFAHYYNNLGVQHIADGSYAQAFLHIRQALELSPDDSHFWSNLGVLYRRTGHLDKADVALLHAINLDHRNYSAMTNLVALYRQQGNASAAQEFSERVERWRYQNPYYRYAEAKKAFELQDFSAAQAHLNYVIERLNGWDDPVLLDFSARVRDRLNQSEPK